MRIRESADASKRDAQRHIILLSSATAARREANRKVFERLFLQIDWPQLTEMLRLRRLLPTLGPRILEMAKGDVDPTFALEVKRAIETGHRRSVFLQMVSEQAMGALSNAGIRSTALKGPRLAEFIYGDPGRRFSNDVDLLVAPNELYAAVETLRDLEYDPPTDHIEDNGLPLLHFSLTHKRSELPPIELHWRIHWYEKSFAYEKLLPPKDPPALWRPDPVDEFAALLLFYARDGFIDLRLASDLSAWWDAFGAMLQSDAVAGLIARYPTLSRAIPTAIKVAEQTVGLPAEQAMPEMPRLGLRQRAALRLANPHPRSTEAQLFADMGLVDGLLAPPGGFVPFIRRNVFPPREVLEVHAEIARRTKPRSRASRAVGILARYALSLGHLLQRGDR